ncbi:MAG TPA: radical SAM family heme chaperone HemW [Candidatus Binatia bacterium]|nr:radical SAM family heme chaperone HemW [Candidatus Binatia bacterium]
MQRQAALYVHIPYCLAKCPYCDFNSYAARTWPEAEYAAALERELAHHAASEPFRDAEIATIFFGGGTPSLFEPKTIARLLDAAARELRVAADAEITLEANPGTVEEGRLRGFRAAGVNRMSFGVQSFQPELLEALGRRHSVDDSRAALAAARRAGFENLSLDLIYAVPGQSLAACEADVDEAIAIAPDHVSAYNLTYEKGTAMFRDLSAGRIAPAGEELEIAMFRTVGDRLAAAGYARYEISNYARPGRAARHNQAYWRGLPYLGLGAGAHSFAPADDAGSARAPGEAADGAAFGARWENLRDPNRYREAVAARGSAIASRESLTRAQAMGEACWLGLRETRGIDAEGFRRRFGEPLADAFPHVAELAREGLVEWRGEELVLTERGLLLADGVFASFL